MIDLDLEELALTELLKMEMAIVSFMLSINMLSYHCEGELYILCVLGSWSTKYFFEKCLVQQFVNKTTTFINDFLHN